MTDERLRCYVSCKCGRVRLPPINKNGDRLLGRQAAIRRAALHNKRAAKQGMTCNASAYSADGGRL
jgi:hypothetical protein